MIFSFVICFWVVSYDFLLYIFNQENVTLRALILFAVAFIAIRAIFDFYGLMMVLFNWLKAADLKGGVLIYRHLKVQYFAYKKITFN